MNREANISCFTTHFYGQSHFGDQFTGVESNDTGTQDAVTVRIEE